MARGEKFQIVVVFISCLFIASLDAYDGNYYRGLTYEDYLYPSAPYYPNNDDYGNYYSNNAPYGEPYEAAEDVYPYRHAGPLYKPYVQEVEYVPVYNQEPYVPSVPASYPVY